MANLKFLKTHVFAFFFVMIIALILIILYKIIGIEKPARYNYDAFPNISPKDLPDARSGQGSCFNKLTPCDGPGNCSKCGEDSFECINVDYDGEYMLNNIKVPKGYWCLPKKQRDLQCGKYTGKWIWSSGGSCPDGKTQCWKCECLYPDLFNGQACMVQQACINRSGLAANKGNQDSNKLIGQEISGEWKGVKWDPNDTSNPDNPVLMVNPYTSDSVTGKPWFACSCSTDTNNNNLPYATLPGDPYNCHIDPCWEYDGYIKSGANCTDSSCTCNCKNGGITVPGGYYKDRCVSDTSICQENGTGAWNVGAKKCNCNTTGISLDCKSDNYPRTEENPTTPCKTNDDCMGKTCDTTTGWCQCTNPKNPVGSECVNPCNPTICNGGVCTVTTTLPYYKCDCSKTTQITTKDCDNINRTGQLSGPNCTQPAYPDGTILQTRKVGDFCKMNGTDGYSPKYCLSGVNYEDDNVDGEGLVNVGCGPPPETHCVIL